MKMVKKPKKVNFKKSNSLISVIVPVHNAELYLRECVDSIIRQTYSNIEIILVDDDSKDGSRDIMNKYQELDGRVRCFHVVEHNAALTRRTGIYKAKGGYVCFVDSDDVLHPEYVSSLFEMIMQYKVDVASVKIGNFKDGARYSSIEYIDTGEVVLEGDMLGYFSNNYHSNETSRQIAQSINAKIFKKDTLNGIDYSVLETSVLEDNYIVSQILANMDGKSVALQDKTLYYYRINSGSTMAGTLSSDSKYGKEKMTYPEFFEETMEYVKSVFHYDERADHLIDKIRAQQYFNLTKHIFHQNKNIDKLKNELKAADDHIESLRAALGQVTREKRAIEESISYKVGSRLIKPIRSAKMFVKRLDVNDNSDMEKK